MAGRKRVIDRDTPGCYHAYARVVRGAYLLEGEEVKQAIIERLQFLVQYFLVQISAVAIMDNHVHYVVHNRPDLVEKLSDEEVIQRARAAFPSYFQKRGLQPSDPTPRKWLKDRRVINEMRGRLSDISWFIHRLHGHLGNQINELLEGTGPVFEPFKCQRFVDAGALLSGCVYVDLNMVRAGMYATPEASKFTSIWYRIQAAEARRTGDLTTARKLDQWLTPIHVHGDHQIYHSGGKRAAEEGLFDFHLDHYAELLDRRGRESRPGKRGQIPKDLAPILERIGVTVDQVLEAADKFNQFHSAVGGPDAIRLEAARRNQRCLQGIRLAKEIFGKRGSGRGKSKGGDNKT